MTARDDYPILPGASTSMYYADLCDELDRLRAELDDTKRAWMDRDNAAALATVLSNSTRLQLLDSQSAIRVQAAELVGLREQLARQAPVIEAAQHMCPAGHVPSNEAERELHDAIIAYRLNWPIEKARAVRALSVPAPPEATEVTG